MAFTFPTFTMESDGLLGIFAMVFLTFHSIALNADGLVRGLFSTFTFQILGCLGMGGLIGIFTMNESGVRLWV